MVRQREKIYLGRKTRRDKEDKRGRAKKEPRTEQSGNTKKETNCMKGIT